MHASTIRAHRFASTFALVGMLALVAGCGGGGGSDAATPSAQTLGTVASSITSSDGKVTVARRRQRAAGAGGDLDRAGRPRSGARRRSGARAGHDLPLHGARAAGCGSGADHDRVAARGRRPPRRRRKVASGALALPPGYFPPPTCLVNAPGFQPVQNVYVDGTECPQSPAPACLKIHTLPGSFDVVNGISYPEKTLCVPAEDVIALPAAEDCPAGYREVTGEPGFAELAAQHALSKICQRLPPTGCADAQPRRQAVVDRLHAEGGQVPLRRAQPAERAPLGDLGSSVAAAAVPGGQEPVALSGARGRLARITGLHGQRQRPERAWAASS